jgi:membrane protease YdiL (CAAX protease family)
VLWEEAAFRGVLQASLRRVLPAPAAIAVTSAVFGLWHIRPTADALRINGVEAGRLAGPVTAAVGATAAAGLLLSGLRERSGSLAAPMLLHLSANSGAVVAAWAVQHAAAARRSGAHPQPGRAGISSPPI